MDFSLEDQGVLGGSFGVSRLNDDCSVSFQEGFFDLGFEVLEVSLAFQPILAGGGSFSWLHRVVCLEAAIQDKEEVAHIVVAREGGSLHRPAVGERASEDSQSFINIRTGCVVGGVVRHASELPDVIGVFVGLAGKGGGILVGPADAEDVSGGVAGAVFFGRVVEADSVFVVDKEKVESNRADGIRPRAMVVGVVGSRVVAGETQSDDRLAEKVVGHGILLERQWLKRSVAFAP